MNLSLFLRRIALCVSLIVASPCLAYAGGENAASKFVEKQASQVLDTISDTKLGKAQKQSRIEKLFAQNIDIPWVGRFVLGVSWRQSDAATQKRYLKAYESFVLSHYATRFSEYTSGSFSITGAEDRGDDEYMVSMEIVGNKKNDPPVLVDYKVRKDKGGFKIFDIIIEGVSMITTQRSEFSSVVSEHGVEGLIKQLESRAISLDSK